MRHCDTVFFQHRHGAGGHSIVIGEHRAQVQVAPKQLDHRGLPALQIRRTVSTPAVRRRQTRRVHRLLIALLTQRSVFDRVIGTQVANTLMTLRQQQAHRHLCAADVIQANAAVFIAGDDSVNQHHARHLLEKGDQFGVTQSFCMNNQGIASLTN
ncbi:hypothetical protein D3C79_849540 [compost metagenome]